MVGGIKVKSEMCPVRELVFNLGHFIWAIDLKQYLIFHYAEKKSIYLNATENAT